MPALQQSIVALIEVLATSAERAGDALMPSYTHLRRAQPILAAHFFLAHAAALRRDHARLDARCSTTPTSCRSAPAPLPAPATRSTSTWLAERLGFSRIVRNSIDATGDRDIVASFLYASSLAMVHLSRLAEDMILFTSEEFGFFELADTAATGSSLMPQKKNPDPLELVRGKAGRVIGRLTGWLATMKGLPIGYSKDLQEDKEALFEAEDTLRASLAATASVVERDLDQSRDDRARGVGTAAGDRCRRLPRRQGRAVPRCARDRRRAGAAAGARAALVRRSDARGLACALAALRCRRARRRSRPRPRSAKKRTPQSTHPDAVAKALAEVQGWVKASE